MTRLMNEAQRRAFFETLKKNEFLFAGLYSFCKQNGIKIFLMNKNEINTVISVINIIFNQNKIPGFFLTLISVTLTFFLL